MLTHLRFKNWRSLKNVEINDLTPITVFIGANSSGKTNIVSGLQFLKTMLKFNAPEATYQQVNRDPIKTIGSDESEPVEIEIAVKVQTENDNEQIVTYCLSSTIEDGKLHFGESAYDGLTKLEATDGQGSLGNKFEFKHALGRPHLLLPAVSRFRPMIKKAPANWEVDQPSDSALTSLELCFEYISQRWQLLAENFIPDLNLISKDPTDLYEILPNGANTVSILNFIQQNNHAVYERFQEDFSWLLAHVDDISIEATKSGTRLRIAESAHSSQIAPTVSGGTARLLSMLAAYYVLDMQLGDMPGLVVIEEPDTALNPGILKNFVELLRTYVDRDVPRQFILTTHNPAFLNLFKPEEVRVVERDEDGYTHVKRIPEHIQKIWLEDGEYGLGDVWMTNSIGGLAD